MQRPTSFSKVVDATSNTHVPCPITLGPYTVVRGRVNLSIQTNTNNSTVVLLGPHTVSTAGLRDLTITPVVTISGVGTDVPGTTELLTPDNLISSYASSVAGNAANGNLHGLTVVLNCLSPTTTVQGQVYVGSLNQRINRSRFATWNAVADSLITRREVKPYSAYNVLSKPLKYSVFPVDIVDWARQVPLVLQAAAPGDNITMDSLSQGVLIFPATAAVVSYTITVYTEWRVNFSDAALASTATTRPASPMDMWNKVAAVGTDTGGFVQALEQGMSMAGALQGAYSVGAGMAKTLGLFL